MNDYTAAMLTPANLRARRRALGLTQQTLADAMGLAERVVRYYEAGMRDGEPVVIPIWFERALRDLERERGVDHERQAPPD